MKKQLKPILKSMLEEMKYAQEQVDKYRDKKGQEWKYWVFMGVNSSLNAYWENLAKCVYPEIKKGDTLDLKTMKLIKKKSHENISNNS